MAATANHPDGNFAGAVEPDEDIAAIAKQISDHAEVIYQTWKSKGLAPNEILTCHNNLNVTNKFGSALTPKFASSTNSKDSDSNVSMTDVLYNNSVASTNGGSLKHMLQKYVVEDKARLAQRQKNADPPHALSTPTAKSYPSSIKYFLQKYEKNSPNPVGYSSVSPRGGSAPSKVNSAGPKLGEQFTPARSNQHPLRVQNANVTSEVDGSSTWPIKNKPWNSESSTYGPSATTGSELNCHSRSSTLPLKKEKNGAGRKNFVDEVAKEEEKLINALKTGAVIAAFGDRDVLSNCGASNAKLPASKSYDSPQLSSEDETDSSIAESSDVSRNTSENSDSCRSTFGVDSIKRKKRTKFAEGCKEDTLSENATTSASRSSAAGQSFVMQTANPIRPFLTRGSVAERVMMFEKCPTEILEKRAKTNTSNAGSWKHLTSDVHRKIQNYCKEADQRKPVHPPHTTIQRNTKANRNIFIPRFYYPHGKPITEQQQNIMLKNVEDIFRVSPDLQVTKEQFASVTKACGCPLYWKAPLFAACGGEKLEHIDMNTFLDYWRNLTAVCHDDASKFMRIVTRGSSNSYIVPEDLIPLVQDVVDTHPGLTFLKQAPEFHSRYVHTVICRVYYGVNQSWSGKISLTELRKSDFLHAMQLLEDEEDINQITAYFSYEHFYVIYCKFWELDRDHDLFISKEDLARHSDHALSSRIIDRIFAKTRNKSRSSSTTEGKMSYTDFVIFLLAEEDKRHPRAIEYWFRCMDLDGDGYLSMYELEHFYDEQLQRMEAMGIECLPFEDCLCQMMDMIQPKCPGRISLSDLKRCKMTPVFFDTFFNLEKYLDHEQRDPFASHRNHENDISDWDRYAAEEYELLVAEESGNDQCDDIDQFDVTETDDQADDIFSSNLDNILNGSQGLANCENAIADVDSPLVFNRSVETNNDSSFANYRNIQASNGRHSDSSDDYAGDSDDCSL